MAIASGAKPTRLITAWRASQRSSWAPINAPSKANAIAPGNCMTARINRPAVSRECTAGSALKTCGSRGLERGEQRCQQRPAPQRQAVAGAPDEQRLVGVVGAECTGHQRLGRYGQRVQHQGEEHEQLGQHLVCGERRRVDVRGDRCRRVPHCEHRDRAHREVHAAAQQLLQCAPASGRWPPRCGRSTRRNITPRPSARSRCSRPNRPHPGRASRPQRSPTRG